MTVNVTTLLTLTTIFMAISNSLPRTSYVKLIDIWLIFNLMIPFMEIILTTLNTVFADDEKNDERTVTRVLPAKEPVVQSQKFIQTMLTNLTDTDPKADCDGGGTTEIRKTSVLPRLVRFMSRIGLPGLYVVFCITFFSSGKFMM